MRILLSAAIFLLGAAIPHLLLRIKARRWGMPALMRIDFAAGAATRQTAECLRAIAVRMDELPARMILKTQIAHAAQKTIEIDWQDQQNIIVRATGEPEEKVMLRGRWIPDHPVPLRLGADPLYIEPVDANRFRVMQFIPFEIPGWAYAAFSLAATAGVAALIPELLAAGAGLALGCATSARLFRALGRSPISAAVLI